MAILKSVEVYCVEVTADADGAAVAFYSEKVEDLSNVKPKDKATLVAWGQSPTPAIPFEHGKKYRVSFEEIE